MLLISDFYSNKQETYSIIFYSYPILQTVQRIITWEIAFIATLCVNEIKSYSLMFSRTIQNDSFL